MNLSARERKEKRAARADSLRERAARLSAALARLYPEARISLDFETPWQCLVATILSAQCTDERVNRVTPALFREIPDIAAMASAPAERIERLIVTTGFFRQKTKSLQGAARQILERFGGQVPRTMEELVTLPGVGRKTANVLLGHVFGQPGLVVDTHVRRLSRRLGLALTLGPRIPKRLSLLFRSYCRHPIGRRFRCGSYCTGAVSALRGARNASAVRLSRIVRRWA